MKKSSEYTGENGDDRPYWDYLGAGKVPKTEWWKDSPGEDPYIYNTTNEFSAIIVDVENDFQVEASGGQKKNTLQLEVVQGDDWGRGHHYLVQVLAQRNGVYCCISYGGKDVTVIEDDYAMDLDKTEASGFIKWVLNGHARAVVAQAPTTFSIDLDFVKIGLSTVATIVGVSNAPLAAAISISLAVYTEFQKYDVPETIPKFSGSAVVRGYEMYSDVINRNLSSKYADYTAYNSTQEIITGSATYASVGDEEHNDINIEADYSETTVPVGTMVSAFCEMQMSFLIEAGIHPGEEQEMINAKLEFSAQESSFNTIKIRCYE
jgi:hypothetical protein